MNTWRINCMPSLVVHVDMKAGLRDSLATGEVALAGVIGQSAVGEDATMLGAELATVSLVAIKLSEEDLSTGSIRLWLGDLVEDVADLGLVDLGAAAGILLASARSSTSAGVVGLVEEWIDHVLVIAGLVGLFRCRVTDVAKAQGEVRSGTKGDEASALGSLNGRFVGALFGAAVSKREIVCLGKVGIDNGVILEENCNKAVYVSWCDKCLVSCRRQSGYTKPDKEDRSSVVESQRGERSCEKVIV